MAAVEIIFWVAVGLLVYTYFGYPLVLFAVTTVNQLLGDLWFLFRRHGRRKRLVSDEDLPTVSLVIPAHNEEASIAAKLENALSLDYPGEKLEIIVGSDGSDDRTDEIVESFADRGVVLAAYEERRGKPSVLNDTMARATGEVVVLSDATTMIEKDAVRKFARHFLDERVGAVNGYMDYVRPEGGTSHEGAYWHYEEAIKFMEGKLGVVLGATGPMYAVRRSAYQAIRPDCIIDDFVIPLRICGAGYRAVYDTEARATETSAAEIEGEAARRIRIGAGNFQALAMTIGLLNPLRGRLAWCYFSHKVLKWVSWLFMALALVANVGLVLRAEPPATARYQVLLGLQVMFYVLAGVGALRPRVPLIGKLFSIPYYFVSMHVALFRGFLRWLRGSQSVKWGRSYR